jgi:hypothetical protein
MSRSSKCSISFRFLYHFAFRVLPSPASCPQPYIYLQLSMKESLVLSCLTARKFDVSLQNLRKVHEMLSTGGRAGV